MTTIILRKSDFTGYAIGIGVWDELTKGVAPMVETIEVRIASVKSGE